MFVNSSNSEWFSQLVRTEPLTLKLYDDAVTSLLLLLFTVPVLCDAAPSAGRILLSLRVIIKLQQIVAELQIWAEAYWPQINTAACKRSLTRCQPRLTSVKYAT